MYPRFLQFGAFVISTYGVLALVAAWCALSLWTALARRLGLNAEKIQNAGILFVVSTIVGARLTVIFANWRGFLLAPILILATGTLQTGNAAAIGAALGLVVLVTYLLREHISLPLAFSAAAPAAMLGMGVLDVANFAAGTHWGSPTRLPWHVIYTDRFAARTAGVPLGIGVHPVQIYSALAHFGVAALLIVLLRQSARGLDVLGAALFAEGLLQFLLEPLTGSFADAAVYLHAFTAVQLSAMVMVALGGLCWIRTPWERTLA